ncbi:MAG: hypothetical protein SF053_20985 [Bacteroidia bacterium]|nr:hypothetical protein [Bacteroidia bacterium]
MKEMYRKDGQTIIEDQLGFSDRENRILFSDSLFETLALGPEARVALVKSWPEKADSLLWSVPLRELPQYLLRFSSFAPLSISFTETSLGGDTLILTEQAQGMATQHALVVFDYVQNRLIFKYLDRSRKDFLWSGSDFSRQEWLRQVFGDDNAYEATHRLDPLLKPFQKDHCQIEGVYAAQDTAFLTVSLPYVPPSRKQTPDTRVSVGLLYFLVKVPLANPDQHEVFYLDTKGLGPYDLDLSQLYVKGSTCYLGLFKSELADPNYFLASFRRKGDGYIKQQYHPATLPPLFEQNDWVYDYNSFILCGERLLLNTFPWIWDAVQNQWLLIPVESRRDSLSGYELFSGIEQGAGIRLLYKEDKSWFLGFWDPAHPMQRHEIILPPAIRSSLKGRPFFISLSQIAFVNADNRLTIINLYGQPTP